MEVLTPSETIWQIQRRFAEKILKINNYLSVYATGKPLDEKIKRKSLTYREWLELLMLELEVLPFFKSDLLAIKETSEIVQALELYSLNNNEFANHFPHEVIAIFINVSTGEKDVRFFPGWGEYQQAKKAFQKKEFEVQEYYIIPPRDWIIRVGKLILDVSSEMEILRPRKQIKPRVKFGDVYARRAACDESVRKILDE